MASTLSAFAYRRRLTIDTTSSGANIASSLTSFPVCVAVNATSWGTVGAAHFFDTSNTSGRRVQFFDSSGTNLAYEVEKYDSSNSDAIYWVAVGTLGGNTTTTIDVGYGSYPNGTDQNQTTSVWDGNYVGVWHLGDNSWGTSPEAKDSTSSAVNGTNNGSSDAAGYVARGRSFNGSSNYINFGNASALKPTSAITISMWLNYGAQGGFYKDLISCHSNGTYKGWVLERTSTSSSDYQLVYGNGSAWQVAGAGMTLTQGQWQHIAASISFGGGAGSMKQYLNAVEKVSATSSGAISYDTTSVYLASWPSNVTERALNGTYDELRISKSVRTADWVKAEYWSMKSTAWPGDGWLTVGVEQFKPHIYVVNQSISRSSNY